ncbi:MAG: hypothetical protein QM598_06295 [Protaetiibacter sp.]
MRLRARCGTEPALSTRPGDVAGSFTPSQCSAARLGRMSEVRRTMVGMANIEILEVRAYEPRCLDCGETGPIESSAFWAMAWEEAHVCVAARIDSEAPQLISA